MNEKSLIERLQKFFSPVTDKKWFTPLTGVMSLANPFALLPQLYNCIMLESIAGVSAFMYVIFAILQVVFALVAIKARNLWMFLSMFASVLISLTIVILTIIKG